MLRSEMYQWMADNQQRLDEERAEERQRAPGPHYDDLGMQPHPLRPFTSNYPHPAWAAVHPMRTPIGPPNDFLMMGGYQPSIHPGYHAMSNNAGNYPAYPKPKGGQKRSGRSPRRASSSKPEHPPWQAPGLVHHGVWVSLLSSHTNSLLSPNAHTFHTTGSAS